MKRWQLWKNRNRLEELIRMMPEPRVVRELPGGHLSMIFDLEGFVKIMNDFMDTQKL